MRVLMLTKEEIEMADGAAGMNDRELHLYNEADRLRARVAELESALDEIAKNGENLLRGGLAHFSREEFAETVAWRARHALVGYDEATKAINAAKAGAPVPCAGPATDGSNGQ